LGREAEDSRGASCDFLQRVKAGLIPESTALVIENLDRLSRQGIRVTRQLIERLTEAGIDVHVVSISRIFRAGFENDLTDYIVLGVESERAFKESLYKSERVGSAWASKKRKATNGRVMTSSVPHWLKAGRRSVCAPRPGTKYRLWCERTPRCFERVVATVF
jgi:DNA invertase Pin-like site-specific DNA recombinase